MASFRAARFELSGSVGFVPTMGALHDGHLSLVKAARENNKHVVASVFVNPAQFGPNEDLDKYPRQLERDTELLAAAGVDMIFAPDKDSMYGSNHVTYVDPLGFDATREGIARPGFFKGVATIVTKLFNIVQPSTAYFGQKDAVQCALIKRIVDDLNMPVDVRVMPTVREEDGLAMSSRNAYLTEEERAVSSVVYKSLVAGRTLWEERESSGGVATADSIRESVSAALLSEPLISEVQYVSVDSKITMMPISSVGDEGCNVSLAVKLGNVRLIDNMNFGD
jgi:pantoate--beta-alanine ligase